jgi:two-component system, LytTR family, sensor kinase
MKPFPQRIRDISFWYYHTAGWFLYAAVQLGIFLSWNGLMWKPLVSISIQLAALFFLFLALRWYYKNLPLQTTSLFPLISRIVLASFILTVLWQFVWGSIEYSIFREKFIKFVSDPLHIVTRLSYSFPIFLGWSALYFGIKTWRDWLNEREQTERAIEEAQHAQLQMLCYQLNPHFLFNALNSVRALVDEDARSAKTMITELSEFLRYSLVSRNKPIVTLKDELDAIRLYLSIEQQRYEDKLQVHYEIDKRTEDIPVPSFLIHPLVEDALRSGMQTSTMPLRLEITSTLRDGMMKISVNHSGSHIPTNGNGSFEPGMEQVEARLQELFPGRFHISSCQQNNQAQSILELVITNGLNYEEKIASLAH